MAARDLPSSVRSAEGSCASDATERLRRVALLLRVRGVAAELPLLGVAALQLPRSDRRLEHHDARERRLRLADWEQERQRLFSPTYSPRKSSQAERQEEAAASARARCPSPPMDCWQTDEDF